MAGVVLRALGWVCCRAWTGLVSGDTAALCVAGVALGDMCLRFMWQAWHLVTYTFVLRGRRGTWRHPPAFCVAGVPLGDIHLRFVWQAWHLIRALGWLWAGDARDIHIRFAWHPPSFCAVGVALAHIHFRFAWLVWHVWHSVTFTFVFAWQAWHLSYRAGSWSPHTIFVTHNFHTPSFSHTTLSRTSHTTLSHTRFHTRSFTVLVSCSSALVVLAQAEIADNKPACSSIVSPVEVAVALRNVSVTRPV